MNKKIDSMTLIYNSLKEVFDGFIALDSVEKERIFYALFGIIVLDIIYNKETMVKNTTGINYESLMSDEELENILLYIKDYNYTNGATLFATIRNKLAHGDYYLDNEYIIFNINNNKVKVFLEDFVGFYIDLTDTVQCRFKGKKYKKIRLLGTAMNQFDYLILNDLDLEKLLKHYTLKEYTLKRKDGKQLTTQEKVIFESYLNYIYNNKSLSSKQMDYYLHETFKRNYIVDIKNHKMKSFKDKYPIIKNIMDSINESYNYDKKYLTNIIFTFGENLYRLLSLEFDDNPLIYGMSYIKFMLNDMLKQDINNFDDYIDLKNMGDEHFMLSVPYNEIIAVIELSMIYFCYCYPLESIFKDSKIYTHTDTDLDFSKLNLSEITPSVNKLYDTGKNNLMNELNNRVNGLYRDFETKLEKYNEVKNQRDNLLKKYKESSKDKKQKINEIIKKLDNTLALLDKEYEYYLLSYINEEEKKKELLSKIEDEEYFKKYSIINGIRNAISHGGVYLVNDVNTNFEDIELEFIDEYEGKIEFKLRINLYNLLSLTELENMNITNKYLKNKKKTKID